MIHQWKTADAKGNQIDFGMNIVASRLSSRREEIVLMMLCLLVALTPLIFAARLFEPFIAAKEILIQAGTATAVLFWLLTVRANSWNLKLTPTFIPLLVLTLIGALSLLWSYNVAVSFVQGQYLATFVLLFVVSLNVMGRAESMNALATALLLAGTIEAVYVLLQYSFGDPIFVTGQLPGKWQTFGTLGNPNWTGEFLAVSALVSLGRLTDLRRKDVPKPSARPSTHHLTVAALILMLVALAATLARGAWLALIIGAVAFVMARRRGSNSRLRFKSAIVPLAFTSVAVVVVVVLPLLANRAAVNHLLNLKSINGRLLMSAVTWTMIRDAPWIGHGAGTFGLQFPAYQADTLSQPWAAQFISNASFTSYAHNDYLQLWAELGLFGVLAFGGLIWIVLKRGRALACEPVALGCWAAVISLLVNAAFAFPLHLPTTLMLFVVLVAVVESTAVKKTVNLSNSPVAGRVAIALVTLVLCTSAYWVSYDRFVADAAFWRADASLGNKRWNEAEADIRTAIQHAPTRIEGPTMLGRLYVERGEYEQANTVLDKAQTLGYDAQIYDLKATALEKAGRRIAAIATLNELVWLRPDLQWPRDRVTALTILADGHEENNQ